VRVDPISLNSMQNMESDFGRGGGAWPGARERTPSGRGGPDEMARQGADETLVIGRSGSFDARWP